MGENAPTPFNYIEEVKQHLLNHTNIEQSKEEMKVLDNILFRFWQLKWIGLIHNNCFNLTTAEREICSYYKANWVTRDDYPDSDAYLWSIKPDKDGQGRYYLKDKEPITKLNKSLFPTLKMGECYYSDEVHYD